jgi:hypothetical protein
MTRLLLQVLLLGCRPYRVHSIVSSDNLYHENQNPLTVIRPEVDARWNSYFIDILKPPALLLRSRKRLGQSYTSQTINLC